MTQSTGALLCTELPGSYLMLYLIIMLLYMRTSRMSSWRKRQPNLSISWTLEKLHWCLQKRSESEGLSCRNKRGCWRPPIRLFFFALPFCFLFSVKGMHQRTQWCHPRQRIILRAIGLVFKSTTTKRALKRKQKWKVDKERRRGREGQRRQQHTDRWVRDGEGMTG